MSTTGLVIGKFLPPHLGHHHIINFAQERVDQLTILVCDRVTDIIPAQLRRDWLAQIHPGANVLLIPDNHLRGDDSQGWAQYTKQFLGFTPNHVFTSELYGDAYAKFLGSKHILVDLDREQFKISGSMVRANPFECWDYLHPIMRDYFVQRIAFVGAESTGKTTLAERLAGEYDTNWVQEFGREFAEVKQSEAGSLEDMRWSTSDFVSIAAAQREREDAMSKQARHFLFCDTDAFATSVWHERYMGARSAEVESIDSPSRITLYFLTDPKTPFSQDGTRDGELIRDWMDARFRERMTLEQRKFVRLAGSLEDRVALVKDFLESILYQPFDFAGANKRFIS
jgi:HTH-type transcriptional repressor of NAD biosynthesis genes